MPIWLREEIDGGAQSAKVENPAAQFALDDLEKYPVVIVTHAFFNNKNSHKAHNVLCNGALRPRVLTIVDEQPEDVTIYDVSFSEAAHVWEMIKKDEQQGDEIAAKLYPLVRFVFDKVEGSGLEKPSDDMKTWEAATAGLEWFTTDTAKRYAEAAAQRIPKIVDVFGFAAAMWKTCAFVTRYDSNEPRFVGYENKLKVRPRYGLDGRHSRHRRRHATLPCFTAACAGPAA
jgi:hypothetical protein